MSEFDYVKIYLAVGIVLMLISYYTGRPYYQQGRLGQRIIRWAAWRKYQRRQRAKLDG